jgi:hypothetical protein
VSLPIQSFRLSEVAEAGMDWAGVAGVESGGSAAVQAIGECFGNPKARNNRCPRA